MLVQPRPRSTIMDDLLDEIEGVASGRRLQARRLTASAPFWGCDDTLFECKSVSKMAPTCKLSAKMANWRFFCECSNLEMIFRQMFRPNSIYFIFIRRFRIVIVGRFMVVDPRSGRLTPKQIAVLSQYLEIRAEILQIAPRCV